MSDRSAVTDTEVLRLRGTGHALSASAASLVWAGRLTPNKPFSAPFVSCRPAIETRVRSEESSRLDRLAAQVERGQLVVG